MVEMIGFLISLVALFFLYLKNKAERQAAFEEDELNDLDPLKEFLQVVERKEVRPAPLPKKVEKKRVEANRPKKLHQHQEEENIQMMEMRDGDSPVVDSLKRLPSLKEMVIYHEIIGKPKSFE